MSVAIHVSINPGWYIVRKPTDRMPTRSPLLPTIFKDEVSAIERLNKLGWSEWAEVIKIGNER
jgi:hypothetical protein